MVKEFLYELIKPCSLIMKVFFFNLFVNYHKVRESLALIFAPFVVIST